MINEKGISFRSDTDSEIIAHLIDHYYQDDLLNAIKMALTKMSGAYAIGVICTNEPDKIIAVRKDSPLIVGVSPNGNYIASDIPALLRYTKDIYLIENDEIVVLTKDKVVIYDSMHQIVDRALFKVDWDTDAAEKGGYAHFMMKEINEQPQAVANTLLRRIDQDEKLKLDIKNIDLTKIDKIYIVACGTAYHAGLVAKVAIEELADMPTEVELASEFRYRKNFISDRTLVIIISQSGETLDTLAALREAKKDQARILAIVNVVGSSVSREADDVIYTWAGPEIAVASTKAYTTQLVALYMIALHLARLKGKIDDDHYHEVISLLKAMPDQISMILNDVKKIQQLADEQFNNESVFFLGRGIDVYVAHEGSLKLKEISYINSFATAAGELKHGTIALIDRGTLVIALNTQDKLNEKMLSNIKEVQARKAYVIAIAKSSNHAITKVADATLYIPDTIDLLTPILSIIPLQLFAYYIAVARGCDVDKPKNLAKSVTVE